MACPVKTYYVVDPENRLVSCDPRKGVAIKAAAVTLSNNTLRSAFLSDSEIWSHLYRAGYRCYKDSIYFPRVMTPGKARQL